MLIVGASALRPCRELFNEAKGMRNNSPLVKGTRRAVLCLFLLLAFAHAARPHDARANGEPVQVIPAPKSLTKTGADFLLTRDVRVVPADSKSEDDRFAAQDFIDDVRETDRKSV